MSMAELAIYAQLITMLGVIMIVWQLEKAASETTRNVEEIVGVNKT